MISQIRNKERRQNRQEHVTCDLVIVGGGLSGTCCAIAAARSGMQVALVQDRPVLGGNASSEIRVWALGATSHMGNNNRWAREGGIIDEIMVENMHRNKEGNPLLFDVILIEKVMQEKNIKLFLNTAVYDIEKRDRSIIKSIKAFNPQNETEYTFYAKYFCDASGDGIVGYLSGAAFRIGAEERTVYDEGFSPSGKYGELLGHTIFLYPKTTDHPVKYIGSSLALQDMTVIPKLHQINPSQSGCNYWWFEYGGDKDTIYDSEEIKLELWRVVYGAWNYIKNSGKYPEAENMTLEWVGMIPGKRESRRFEGLYTMTQNDIVTQRIFNDAISYGGWAIDLHPSEGVYASGPSCNQYHAKGIYSIPYRCFVSRDIDNLFFAGRLISVSHVAHGSTRVMITCAHGGQAVGMAAALCKKKDCMPKDLLADENIKELQYILSINGQSIPHIAIDESRNLLAKASVKASSAILFKGFPANGIWRRLNVSAGQLLPLKAGINYDVELVFFADEKTDVVIEWAIASKPYNYTPDVNLQSETAHITKGISEISTHLDKPLEHDQYAFLIVRHNDKVAIRMSQTRMTGMLSVFNKFSEDVNNFGRQVPPKGSGFEDFEFFTPERRPAGHNIAFSIQPALDCFGAEQLVNGFVRPYIHPNAWVASMEDECPELTFEMEKKTEIHEIKIFFDTDYDYPMETVQWKHEENDMPFCVAGYAIYDENNKEIVSVKDNFQTINSIKFDQTISIKALKFVFNRKATMVPVSVFQIEVN